jgi:hypothetical protein
MTRRILKSLARLVGLTALAWLGMAGQALAGQPAPPAGEAQTAGHDEPARRVEFVGTPMPIINPTVGNGLAGVAGLAVRFDPDDAVSPPSFLAVGAGATSNGTWGWGVGGQVYLWEDRFRVQAIVGSGRVRYDFYGTGNEAGDSGFYLPVELDVVTFLVEPKVHVGGRWYIGPRYYLLDSSAGVNLDRLLEQFPELPPDLPEIPGLDTDVRSAALGLRVQRDSRDSTFYPRAGSVFDTTLDVYDSVFGSQRNYEDLEVSYQGYQGIGSKNVLAYRATVCATTGDAPFYALCLFGRSQDIRGYAIGQYQDRRMLVGQVEYRRDLFWRFGGVAYFGSGAVARSLEALRDSRFRLGGGIGLRFTLAKENRINLLVDYAWGRGSSAFYVGLGEAF